jgi:hypothetical protein
VSYSRIGNSLKNKREEILLGAKVSDVLGTWVSITGTLLKEVLIEFKKR